MSVEWSQIMAECDGYRNGFVAVFRKYEGQPTNEKDPQGRPLKVSQRTFAEHLGVAEATLRRWIKNADTGAPLSGRAAGGAPARGRSGQIGRQIAKSPTVGVDDKVGMLSDLLSDKKVVRAFREKRAPITNEADAKAAQAVARALTEPIANGATGLQVPMWVDQLREIARELSEWELSADDVKTLDRVVRMVTDEIEVQKFRLGMEVAS